VPYAKALSIASGQGQTPRSLEGAPSAPAHWPSVRNGGPQQVRTTCLAPPFAWKRSSPSTRSDPAAGGRGVVAPGERPSPQFIGSFARSVKGGREVLVPSGFERVRGYDRPA
jgi:hypothetical protein